MEKRNKMMRKRQCEKERIKWKYENERIDEENGVMRECGIEILGFFFPL